MGKEYGPEMFCVNVSSVQYLGENHCLIDFGGIVKNAAGDAAYNIMDGITGSSQSQVFEIKDGAIIFHDSVKSSGLYASTFRAVGHIPCTSDQEMDLTTGHTRLGSLYRYGDAEPIFFRHSTAMTGGPTVNAAAF